MWDGDQHDHDLTRELRLAAVELGLSPVLGQDIRLELTPDITVLVGRNGAGKSALLERIRTTLHHISGMSDTPSDVARVACDLALGEQQLRYECTRTPTVVREDIDRIGQPASAVEERCLRVAPTPGSLWSVAQGRFLHDDGRTEAIPHGTTCMQWMLARGWQGSTASELIIPLFNLFASVTHITPAALRGDDRRELIVPAMLGRWSRSPEFSLRRNLGFVVYRLKAWDRDDRLSELVAIARRIGLCQEIRIKTYRDPDRTANPPNDLISVEVDGVDLGLLSDGTIRVLQILCDLIAPDTKVVLIDEPESAVHPGLLGKLLHELAAYSTDRQVVLSTHSPQVVSWARPDAIRLVTRVSGATHVQGLTDRALLHLEKYLHDEDSLGHFIYSGGLDDLTE